MELTTHEITIKRIVIEAPARLDVAAASDFRAGSERLLAEGHRCFVLDLSETEFLDSSGLAALVSLLKRARQVGGDAKLVPPRSETALRILKLTKFDQVFDMAESVDSALLKF